MTTAVTAALVAVGGTLLAGKIQSNRAKDPKAAIGSGTSPSLSPGEGGQYTPVAGSELQDFGDFQYENMTEPEGGDEEQLLAMLQQMGMDGGVVNAAYGGELEYKAGGGGIGDLLQPEQLDKLLAAIGGAGERPNMDVIDFTSVAEPDLADIMVAQLAEDPNNLITNFTPEFETDVSGVMTDELSLEEVPTGMLENAKIGIENYAVDNPEMFSAGLGALSDVVMAALRDMPERKGSNVRTQTLPGNASRRRSQLQNISPIGGSSVTFAKNGSALQRPMFMPQGGAMNGPGGPKDDLIPVMASNGEYMLSKAAVDAAGNGSHAMGIANLNKFNDMGNKRYGN
tara:strand:+ start:4020 stop:5042 length:1023 start_codon:yes stop_codon:yes gene_type:complete